MAPVIVDSYSESNYSILANIKDMWPGDNWGENCALSQSFYNADSARRLREAIGEYLNFGRLILIAGASSDKDIAGMLGELAPVSSLVIVTRSRHPRALEPALILDELERQGVKGELEESVSSAAERALAIAGPDDLICATGSLFVAAEAREHIKGIPFEIY